MNNTNILYDGFIFTLQRVGGINRYFTNLINRLPPGHTPHLTIAQPAGQLFPTHRNLKISHFQRFCFRPGRLCYWTEKQWFRYHASTTNYDIFHPTYYYYLTRSTLSQFKGPKVITIYDLIYETFSKTLDPHGRDAAAKKEAVESADVVLCISNFTESALHEFYPRSRGKTKVTYLAADLDISQSYGDELIPIQPYFLFVGGRGSYKNFSALLKAFSIFTASNPDYILCVAGAPFIETEQLEIADLKLEGKVQTCVYPNDAHLAKLYRCSQAFIYPSLCEGFGIPLLEAMQCQTAVLASNRTSLPEVADNAAIYFDPSSPEDMAGSMHQLTSNLTRRSQLIDYGSKRSKDFSWDKTAKETISVYSSLLH